MLSGIGNDKNVDQQRLINYNNQKDKQNEIHISFYKYKFPNYI